MEIVLKVWITELIVITPIMSGFIITAILKWLGKD